MVILDAYDIGQLVDHAQFEPIKLIGEGSTDNVFCTQIQYNYN